MMLQRFARRRRQNRLAATRPRTLRRFAKDLPHKLVDRAVQRIKTFPRRVQPQHAPHVAFQRMILQKVVGRTHHIRLRYPDSGTLPNISYSSQAFSASPRYSSSYARTSASDLASSRPRSNSILAPIRFVVTASDSSP